MQMSTWEAGPGRRQGEFSATFPSLGWGWFGEVPHRVYLYQEQSHDELISACKQKQKDDTKIAMFLPVKTSTHLCGEEKEVFKSLAMRRHLETCKSKAKSEH